MTRKASTVTHWLLTATATRLALGVRLLQHTQAHVPQPRRQSIITSKRIPLPGNSLGATEAQGPQHPHTYHTPLHHVRRKQWPSHTPPQSATRLPLPGVNPEPERHDIRPLVHHKQTMLEPSGQTVPSGGARQLPGNKPPAGAVRPHSRGSAARAVPSYRPYRYSFARCGGSVGISPAPRCRSHFAHRVVRRAGGRKRDYCAYKWPTAAARRRRYIIMSRLGVRGWLASPGWLEVLGGGQSGAAGYAGPGRRGHAGYP